MLGDPKQPTFPLLVLGSRWVCWDSRWICGDSRWVWEDFQIPTQNNCTGGLDHSHARGLKNGLCAKITRLGSCRNRLCY